MLSPVVDEVAAESDGSYKVGKVNVDDEAGIAMQFGIASIPTLLVFKGCTRRTLKVVVPSFGTLSRTT